MEANVRKVLATAFVLVSLWTQAAMLRAQPAEPAPKAPANENADFRVETAPVAGGAEIVTIFARYSNTAEGESSELPLISILRDTLGDDIKENDRLRYVWVLSYTDPSFSQKASAFVPFLYMRTTNKKQVGTGPPPKVADLQPTDKTAWQRATWVVLKKLLLSDIGIGPRASVLQYRQNTADYRRSAIVRALTVLSVYESSEGENVFSEEERRDMQARLMLDDKLFGWHMASDNLSRVYQKGHEKDSDIRSQNWELLRQYSEAQGLYFEPLKMADGTAHHAVVWAAAEDIEANRGKKYDSRFLNIKNPWTDAKLTNWKGYSEVRWYDADGREVDENTPGAVRRTMIPLALYGLDHPKVPALLIDFRDNGNAKRREMSRRVLHDVTSNVLSMSSFGNAPYMLGRFALDFVTGRRGMDINQVSRLRAYSQLKLLIALDDSLDDRFRSDIAKRVENVSLNPLENDTDIEATIARRQYENLMAYAVRPDGLPAKLQRLRREEMVSLVHGPAARAFFKAAHAITFGRYTHRETATAELLTQIDTRRQLEFHERRLAEIARHSIKPEIDSNITLLRESLAFISANGSAAKDKTVRLIAKIYTMTDDEGLRDLCVAGLYEIDSASAKNQLLAIYHDPNTDPRIRAISARYLKLAVSEGHRVSSRNTADIEAIGTN